MLVILNKNLRGKIFNGDTTDSTSFLTGDKGLSK
jgi:hypothetical protein